MVRKNPRLPGLILISVLVVMIANLAAPDWQRLARAATPPPTCAPGACSFTPLPEPKQAKLDQAALAKIDLTTLPAVPDIPSELAAIYQEGARRGNNPRVFSKVGDCMTATDDFLVPFGKADYDLGSYTALKQVIDYFAGVPARGKKADFDSFTNPSLAATSGFNAPSVLDATWSDPKWCGGDESPLTCEFRVSKPGFAVIMFGTNDIKSITADQYDFYLRRVIVQTVNSGVVPVLSTFPTQPGMEDKSVLYNQVTAKIAADYHIPLINLWVALELLPNRGVDPANTTHMTRPADGHTASFSEPDLQAGYNVRNLLTLQTLAAVLKAVNADAVK